MIYICNFRLVLVPFNCFQIKTVMPTFMMSIILVLSVEFELPAYNYLFLLVFPLKRSMEWTQAIYWKRIESWWLRLMQCYELAMLRLYIVLQCFSPSTRQNNFVIWIQLCHDELYTVSWVLPICVEVCKFRMLSIKSWVTFSQFLQGRII